VVAALKISHELFDGNNEDYFLLLLNFLKHYVGRLLFSLRDGDF
jgi:hypothetical protein